MYQLIFGLITGSGVVATVTYFFLLRRKSIAGQAPDDSPGGSNQGNSSEPNCQINGNDLTKHSFLLLEFQGKTICSFELDKDEHRLGRDSEWSDCNIPTSWEVISRRHAVLCKEGKNYRIYDGDRIVPSRNGLWINNNSCVDLKDGYPLFNGDRLKIGKDVHEQITLTYYNPNSNQEILKTTKMAN